MTGATPQGRPLRTAEIIAVGSELLTPWRLDTNSLFITERLNEIGIEIKAKAIVGDNRGDLAALFRQALARADLVIVTGGLGPTDDDLTRDVVADALGLPLAEDERISERIRQRFASRGLEMPEINRRQGMVPRGARVLDNVNGTAPGLWIEHGESLVVLLPGPPREMQPMIEGLARGDLSDRSGGSRLYRRVLHVTGRTESHVEEAAQPVYSRWLQWDIPVTTTILASPGQIELHLSLRAESPDEGQRILDMADAELIEALGRDVYSRDGRSLEQVVGDHLRRHHLKVAIAESCTGGLLASRLTDVPGSSDYVECGIVTYSDRAKIDLLGVPGTVIKEHGAVSEPVASAMAAGIRERAGVHLGVGVTGIAGPGGGSERKPVGTVAIAVAGPVGRTQVRTLRFPGDRKMVKRQASQAALDMLRRVLEDLGA